MRIWVAVLAVLVLWPSAARAQQATDEAKALFTEKCSSCHTIGEGMRVGPDLKGVTDKRSAAWLKGFVAAPSSKLDSDPDAKALLAEYKGVRMPDLGLTEPQVAGLIDLFAACSKAPCDFSAKFTAAADLTSDDAVLGVKLFTGEVELANGGPACISCHTVRDVRAVVGGGNLALELTGVFGKLGDQGVEAALKNPAFPLMNKIFVAQPLTPEEVTSLRAMFYQSSRNALTGIGGSSSWPTVPLLGAFGAVAFVIALNAAWSRRNRGVRARLVSEASESRREVD
ncbi:MAG: cytochrome c [Myxococcales bacterium]|nr:cytochrome c [Myxococcales bacterium]